MAKRKRGQSQAQVEPQNEEDFYNTADSKLKIRTYEDIADSEDDFHAGRDEVLLDKARGGKRRKQEEDMMELSDEEVLLDGDSDVDGADEVYDDPEVDDGRDVDAEEEGSEDGDELSGFGTARADYYGADALETEQDALEEEEEARRIQQKNLKALKAADFGFDENEWRDDGADQKGENDEDKAVMEVLPQLQIAADMGPAERLKLLKQRYPLFEPLSKEFLNLQDRYEELALIAAEARKTRKSEETPLSVIQYHALSGYLGALAMYFALLTSTAQESGDVLPLSPQEMQNHPIFTSIEKCQKTWQKVQDLEEFDSSEDEQDEEAPEAAPVQAVELVSKPKKSKTSKSSKAVLNPATAASEARRAARLARTEASLAALSNTLSTAPRPTKKPSTKALPIANDSDSDLGDEAPLSAVDAEEKARKRKSLRFYTSQIAQKAAKRANAGHAAGGDEDIPYRERFRDKQERLNREAAARGQKGKRADAGAALGSGSDDEHDGEPSNLQRERADDGDHDDDDATRLLARASAKKAGRASREAIYKEAKAVGGKVVRVPTTDANSTPLDGKRAVGYTIEKNKGLMPRRKKEFKNPRVKKRKKFEEKTKKLASMKPVFKKEGEGKGGYKGQLTGIKSNLVRGVKF